jgi:NitT/TauT family transport system substrate-binding protein
LAQSGGRRCPAFVRKLVTSPEAKYTTTPLNVTKDVTFMAKTGAIKGKADSWKDLFFPEVYGEPGS